MSFDLLVKNSIPLMDDINQQGCPTQRPCTSYVSLETRPTYPNISYSYTIPQRTLEWACYILIPLLCLMFAGLLKPTIDYYQPISTYINLSPSFWFIFWPPTDSLQKTSHTPLEKKPPRSSSSRGLLSFASRLNFKKSLDSWTWHCDHPPQWIDPEHSYIYIYHILS